MKKQGLLWIALAVTVFLSACSVRNVTRGMEEGEHYDAVISVKGNSDAQEVLPEEAGPTSQVSKETQPEKEALTENEDQLGQLRRLLGKSDEETADMFGGGEENRTADGSVLVGRNYETELFETTVHLYTSYDENRRVGMIFLEAVNGEAEHFLELLTETMGTAPEVLEETEGSGWQWQLPDCVITLYEIEGTVSMDLIPAF